MYFNEVSDYLTELSLAKKSFKIIPSNLALRTIPILDNISPFMQAKLSADKPKESNVQIPNYIDPNTGKPYDPFREDEERGKRIHRLRMQRAVLP